MSGWDRMFEYWHKTYYCDVFMFACELTAIILGIIYQRKNRIGQFFIYYVLLDILLLVFDIYLYSFPALRGKEYSYTLSITNTFSYLGELLAYFFFFQLTLKNKLIIRLIPILRFSFVLLAVLHLLNTIAFRKPITGDDMYPLGIIEFFFLLIPCLFYYSELFSVSSVKNLFQRPSFWITTGIFFYTIISIPYYFIADYLAMSKYIYNTELDALFFAFPYGVTFLFLSKAFSLKTELTT